MRKWTDEEIKKLKHLSTKNLFYTEIAKELGRDAVSVRHKAKSIGIQSTQERVKGRFGKWNSKHSHLRKAVMTYFLNHTWGETREHFGLTQSELKSIFTVGYRLPQFKHLRKETRDHSPWTADQLKTLLRYSGLRPREFVAKKIGRGNAKSCIKERLMKLGIASRNLQGLTLSQFRQLFGKDPRFYLQTDAGPNGGLKTSLPTRWKIVPWVWLDREIGADRLKTKKEIRIFINARARFQDWIFEGNSIRKMKRILKEMP